jgi:DNA repair photolyase
MYSYGEMRTPLEKHAYAGRGALTNPPGRFERRAVEAVHDGWEEDPLPDRLPTTVLPERAKRLITRNDSPDIGFDYSINPYRGCEHGCIYCYARPSHAYLGLSAGIDFETRLFYKDNAGPLLEQELADPAYACRPIMLGANTDPYQPVEQQLRVTRSVLEVLARTRHPVAIVTKGTLVLRDLDLLADLARDGLASVAISVTTLADSTKRALEPRTASGAARLRVLRALRAAGVPAGVLVAPVIPAITDHEMESIVAAAAEAGASWAAYVLLRLPYEIKDLFRTWLAEHFPDRAAHVMALVRDMRGGRDNDPAFGSRMRGTGPLAELLRARFQRVCRQHGLNTQRRGLMQPTHLFRAPGVRGRQQDFGF